MHLYARDILHYEVLCLYLYFWFPETSQSLADHVY